MESPPLKKARKNSSSSSLQEYLYEADWNVSRCIAKLFTVILYSAVLFVSYLFLTFFLSSIVEYQEGLSDISNLEIIFFIFFILFIKRYISYTVKTNMGLMRLITTPLYWLGKLSLALWFLISIVGYIAIKSKEVDLLNALYISHKNNLQLVAFIIILLSLYVSVPSKKKRTFEGTEKSETNQDTSATESEPTIRTGEF